MGTMIQEQKLQESSRLHQANNLQKPQPSLFGNNDLLSIRKARAYHQIHCMTIWKPTSSKPILLMLCISQADYGQTAVWEMNYASAQLARRAARIVYL